MVHETIYCEIEYAQFLRTNPLDVSVAVGAWGFSTLGRALGLAMLKGMLAAEIKGTFAGYLLFDFGRVLLPYLDTESEVVGVTSGTLAGLDWSDFKRGAFACWFLKKDGFTESVLDCLLLKGASGIVVFCGGDLFAAFVSA